ncbi:hypothetical protein EV192_106255 [Actinocrispum wychmicini]|uniref:DUF7192 domain-containing protein n=2 Tax=Actinocrispum wychmicini TaxID=1213861 RepID=A0A4V2S6P0_9PSEU|nr:hypothetical protein EV192_106255 [Actinocrispum wychmicini]
MGRVISLAVNIGASYDISAMDMIERGKSIVALVYALERIGIRTEVFTDSQSKGSKGTSETIRQVVKVKDAADALDPAMIMFTLAHPAFYRGLVMASKHEHPRRFHKPLKIGNTYGYPIDRLSNEVFPNECIILKTVMRSDDRNVSDVEAFVVSHLKDLGLI